jgi:hypothetical protein
LVGKPGDPVLDHEDQGTEAGEGEEGEGEPVD